MNRSAMTFALPIFALSALGAGLAQAAPARAAEAATVAPGDTLLTLSAEGKASREPDMAMFSAGVASTGRSAGEAMAANAEAMNQVLAALKAAGVPAKDIQTSQLSLSPSYEQRNPRPGQVDSSPPRIVGYTANNTVSLRSHDLANVGRVLDALVAAGANQVSGPDFALDHPETALDEARLAAVKTARARAELYARAAGLKVLRVVSISESGGYQPRPVMAMARMAAEAAPTPIAAGELDMTVNVSVQFELAPQ